MSLGSVHIDDAFCPSVVGNGTLSLDQLRIPAGRCCRASHSCTRPHRAPPPPWWTDERGRLTLSGRLHSLRFTPAFSQHLLFRGLARGHRIESAAHRSEPNIIFTKPLVVSPHYRIFAAPRRLSMNAPPCLARIPPSLPLLRIHAHAIALLSWPHAACHHSSKPPLLRYAALRGKVFIY